MAALPRKRSNWRCRSQLALSGHWNSNIKLWSGLTAPVRGGEQQNTSGTKHTSGNFVLRLRLDDNPHAEKRACAHNELAGTGAGIICWNDAIGSIQHRRRNRQADTLGGLE